ncbi:MAG: hypothetical protein R2769_05780 [Saprospiraceae bacterium]
MSIANADTFTIWYEDSNSYLCQQVSRLEYVGLIANQANNYGQVVTAMTMEPIM